MKNIVIDFNTRLGQGRFGGLQKDASGTLKVDDFVHDQEGLHALMRVLEIKNEIVGMEAICFVWEDSVEETLASREVISEDVMIAFRESVFKERVTE